MIAGAGYSGCYSLDCDAAIVQGTVCANQGTAALPHTVWLLLRNEKLWLSVAGCVQDVMLGPGGRKRGATPTPQGGKPPAAAAAPRAALAAGKRKPDGGLEEPVRGNTLEKGLPTLVQTLLAPGVLQAECTELLDCTATV